MNVLTKSVRTLAVVLAVSGVWMCAAQGQSYKPSLGDIMGATQLRHFKLWFAGKLANWPLAAYELEQIRASFSDAMRLYPNIPVADLSIMGPAAQKLDQAIKAEDSAKFARAFGEMTDACNSCHQSIGRGFIKIQIPAASPFSNQSFEPSAKGSHD